MPLFRVATDSGCDLTDVMCREREIYALPMKYNIGDKVYADNMNQADLKSFYASMRDGVLPKTSSVNIDDYLEFWGKLFEESDLPLVHICMGSGISATYQNGVAAYEQFKETHPDAKIFVVDSVGASASYGILTLEAANMRDAGKTAEETAKWCSENGVRCSAYYTTGNLKWLQLGGRVSRTGATIAHALNIWPFMALDDAGKLYVSEKIRGKRQVFDRLVAVVRERAEDIDNHTMCICHTDIPDDAEMLADRLRKECGVKNIIVSYIGSTIGCHAGPGLVAVFFLGKPRPPKPGKK